MTVYRLVAVFSAALAWSALPAQTPAPPVHAGPIVYKCTNPDGSVVYSASACSADPAKVTTIDTSAALRTGSGGHQGEIAASVADSDCRAQAMESTHTNGTQISESNRHIADYERRRQELQAAQAAYPAATGAGANDGAPAPAADTTQALADLDASIAAEREFQAKASTSTDAAYQDALRRCDDELRKSAQPPPSPPTAAPAPAKSGTDGAIQQ